MFKIQKSKNNFSITEFTSTSISSTKDKKIDKKNNFDLKNCNQKEKNSQNCQNRPDCMIY